MSELVAWDELEKTMTEDLDLRDTADTYGIRVVFGERDSDRIHVALMPWVTHEVDKAHWVCHLLIEHASEGMTLLAGWVESGDVNLPANVDLQPLATRVVKLAPIPF